MREQDAASTPPAKRRRIAWLRYLLIIYALTLAASHLYRWLRHPPEQGPALGDERFLDLRAVSGDQLLQQRVKLAVLDLPPTSVGAEKEAPAVVLIHGSPGSRGVFTAALESLRRNCRVVVPDLPGFGRSDRDLPDYSIRAHARYLLQMLDQLDIESAHIVGFSMGGGVAINLEDIAPQRVRSLTLLAAIGVQEFELLGNYQINHLVHGLQLGLIWMIREGWPHFGSFDRSFFGVAYARNFFDSDQRPLRGMLEQYSKPMLIMHGREDPLVPVEAALEHYRIVPQSELNLNGDDHFELFTGGGERIGEAIAEFVQRADSGGAAGKAQADPERQRAAQLPLDPGDLPSAEGIALIVLWLLIAAATLVSEDLACIGAGLAVAAGRIDFMSATLACLAGIYIGDIGLYWLGRGLGRPALRVPPLKWMLDADSIDRSSRWMTRNGLAVIALSRFVPGSRLPTYFAAGMLHTRFLLFSLYLIIPALVWTPALVGLALYLGQDSLDFISFLEDYALLGVAGFALAILLATNLIVPMFTWRGRRQLAASWKRRTQWEFWPAWLFYSPLVLYVFFYLMPRYRSMTVFSAANPGIAEGGFIGESKSQILDALRAGDGEAKTGSAPDPEVVARYRLIPAPDSPQKGLEQVRRFQQREHLGYPLALKPDWGQRGRGVRIVSSDDDVREYFESSSEAAIVQEYVSGKEFGVFYCRMPDQERGRIFSITRKVLPSLQGDGQKTVEELILADKRAAIMARHYFRNLRGRLWETPSKGEQVALTNLGTHARGAIFLDGIELKTDALEESIDFISRRFQGFFFGRYDIRVPSDEDLRQGRNLKVIELNGVTSEATHIYDPRIGLGAAYRVLMKQWRLAFEIGRRNVRLGHRPAAHLRLIQLILGRRTPNRSVPASE